MDKNERGPIQILLVDDDTFVHEMVGSLIDEAEYSLLSATSVVDAMKIILEQRPDVIITDAMMPGESGFSLINRLKSDPTTQNIPIILLTILEEPNGQVMDASGQADFRVSKPLYLSDFSSKLEQARQLIEARSEQAKDQIEVDVQLSDTPDPDVVTVVF